MPAVSVGVSDIEWLASELLDSGVGGMLSKFFFFCLLLFLLFLPFYLSALTGGFMCFRYNKTSEVTGLLMNAEFNSSTF